MIDISYSQTIQGWMSDKELRWLAQQASCCKYIAEIGVWKGRSTSALAQHVYGYVIGVDPFIGNPGDDCPSSDGAVYPMLDSIVRGPDWLEAEAKKNLQTYLDSGKLVLLRMTSAEGAIEVAKRIRSNQLDHLDLVFIDGDHHFEEVYRDIMLWRNLLTPDGLLCGHDFQEPRVRQAVLELIPNAKNPVGTIWTA
jgi:predicted O-methyltransferase YrrM